MDYFKKEYADSKLIGKQSKVGDIFNPAILKSDKVVDMLKKSFDLLGTNLTEFLIHVEQQHKKTKELSPLKPHTIGSAVCYFMDNSRYEPLNINLRGAHHTVLSQFGNRPKILVSMAEKSASIKGWSDAGNFEIETVNGLGTFRSQVSIKCNTNVFGGEMRDELLATFDDTAYAYTKTSPNSCLIVKEKPITEQHFFAKDSNTMGM